MLKKMRHTILMAASAGILTAGPAGAQLKENADGWEQRRIGNKVCFTQHAHYGESPAWPTKAGARAYAIRQWEGMTKWEYGKAWGSYQRAVGKTMDCSKSGSRWLCRTKARPCRPAGRR